MSETDTRSVTELEELLDADIPCEGLAGGGGMLRTECGKPATLRWTNPHGHGPLPDKPYKCMDCWMALYQYLANTLAVEGAMRCPDCGHRSRSVLEHTDYRPF